MTTRLISLRAANSELSAAHRNADLDYTLETVVQLRGGEEQHDLRLFLEPFIEDVTVRGKKRTRLIYQIYLSRVLSATGCEQGFGFSRKWKEDLLSLAESLHIEPDAPVFRAVLLGGEE
jgi:hypothetical protein